MQEKETIAVPRDALAEHVVAQALEHGEFVDYVDAPVEGDPPVDVSDWEDGPWDMDVLPDDTVKLFGRATGRYQVRTRRAKRNPPGAAHPAEYETREFGVGVTVTADLAANNGLGEYVVTLE